jgi:hypothetical protein
LFNFVTKEKLNKIMGTKCVVISGSLASINGSLGGIYSLIMACDFQNIMLFLLYIIKCDFQCQTFADSDFKFLELNGSLDFGMGAEKKRDTIEDQTMILIP